MKILFYSWDTFGETSFMNGLKNAGHEVVKYSYVRKCRHFTRDMELAADMMTFIHQNSIEGVASFSYFPIVSMVCDTVGIPYFSWVYDSPHNTLYAGAINLPCNHIGIFDRDMVEQYKSMGVNTVFHLPLGSDIRTYEPVIKKAVSDPILRKKYNCDVSFVGSLYTGEFDYFNSLNVEPSVKKDSLDLINKYLFKYTEDINPDDVTAFISLFQAWTDAMEEAGLLLNEDFFASKEDLVWPTIFEKKMTVEERRILLSEVAKKEDRDFRLYTASSTKDIPILDKCNFGPVDYYKMMPLVFRYSKINLNISLKSIHSGIPLRVLDILSCGGFALSNYQPEIDEYLVDGEEIVMYKSLEEAMEKIDYYLKHDDERNRIAQKGYKAVTERLNINERIKEFFK